MLGEASVSLVVYGIGRRSEDLPLDIVLLLTWKLEVFIVHDDSLRKSYSCKILIG